MKERAKACWSQMLLCWWCINASASFGTLFFPLISSWLTNVNSSKRKKKCYLVIKLLFKPYKKETLWQEQSSSPLDLQFDPKIHSQIVEHIHLLVSWEENHLKISCLKQEVTPAIGITIKSTEAEIDKQNSLSLSLSFYLFIYFLVTSKTGKRNKISEKWGS